MLKINNTILLLIIILSVFSCKKEDNIDIEKQNIVIIRNSPNYLSLIYKINQFELKFDSEIKDQIVVSNFRIFEKNELLIETKNNIDTKIPSYKLITHKGIIEQAKVLKIHSNLDLINKSKKLFELFAEKILFNQNLDSYSNLVQSLFYHNSILEITKRSFEKKEDCECTPHPGYFVDNNSFWCQEDYLIDVNRFIDVIENNNSEYLIDKEKVLSFLQKKKNSSISIDKISVFMESKQSFMNRVESSFSKANNTIKSIKPPEECEDGQGTDLGCCGNYSGCCWVWSYYCLDHDIRCYTCAHWHCGPSCVPEITISDDN